MSGVLGRIVAVRRYPVKSFRVEELQESFVEAHGLRGDRVYAFAEPGNTSRFPWVSARKVPEMLKFQTLLNGAATDDASIDVEVRTPEGARRRMSDPAFLKELEARWGRRLELRRSAQGHPDAFPVSLLSLQSVRALEGAASLGPNLEPLRFRPNLVVDWAAVAGLAADAPEEAWLGKEIRVGAELVLRIEEKDSRCVIVNLDPETAAGRPEILKEVGRLRKGCMGVYASVVRPGLVRVGDTVAPA
ncbi:MAG: MOSC domain-containing protein [Bdellovibrionales bacterium]|nr:MOSC domain-containing protein [Bdellovibrionales bacterium]